jgi:hypothetical protein
VAELEQRELRGWEVLELSTEAISVTVIPGLGGAVWSLTRRADDAALFWTPPWGLPAYASLSRPASPEVAAISTRGGWQTLFPNAGRSVSVQGVELGFDGEARQTHLDWEYTGSSLVMNGRLIRTPFTITRTLSVRGSELSLGETVRNVGGEWAEVMWGSQLLLGGALLGADTAVDTGATIVRSDPEFDPSASYDDLSPWPRARGPHSMVNLRNVPAEDAAESRLAYLSELTRPWLRVSRPSRQLGFDLEWDGSVWPHLWYRLEAGEQGGFPWYQRGYFLELTPCSSWPAHGLYEARRVADSVLSIPNGSTRTAHATITVDRLT